MKMEQIEIKTSTGKNLPISSAQIFQKDQKITFVKTKMVAVVVIALLFGAIGAAGYFYKQFRDIQNNPNKMAQDELNSILIAVGKLIVLPTGEQPTMATVTDPEKLGGQPFFVHAKKGDKVLIYTNAKKAILYSPEINKIIEVAPLNIGASSK